MNTYICKVTSYNEIKNKDEVEVLIISGDNYADAAQKVEEYYGETLLKVDIEYLVDRAFPIFKEEMYDTLKEEIERDY